MFKVRVSLTTTWEAMRRIGYSAQMPTHRAIERDEQSIAHWRRHQWPAVKSRGRLNAWICFADEARQTLRPAKATTWAARGHTPVVKVTAKGGVRVSVAGLVHYRPGQRTQLDQLMPVPARTRQPRHLQAQHQPHMAHRDLRDQPREPGPLGRIRRRPPQVLINHHHPRGRPAQRGRPVGQPILQPRRLAVAQDLLARRLPDIDDRQPVTMPALNLAVGMLTRQHRAHPRSPPLRQGWPTPPTAPGACPVTSERRSGPPPETTSTVPSPGFSSTPPSGDDARIRTARDVPSPFTPGDRSRSTHSTSRSRPSLPITGVLTAGWPTIPALWTTD